MLLDEVAPAPVAVMRADRGRRKMGCRSSPELAEQHHSTAPACRAAAAHLLPSEATLCTCASAMSAISHPIRATPSWMPTAHPGWLSSQNR